MSPTKNQGRLKSIFRRPFPIRLSLPASITTETANSSPSTNGRCRLKKRTPGTACPTPTGAMRSTTCAVPARYRNRPLPLRFQRQPYRHRPARRQTDQLPVLRQRPSAPNQPRRRSHHRHRTRQTAPRNLPHTG